MPRNPEGKPKLSPTEMRAQATLMMSKRLFGDSTIESLSKEFHMAPRTVQRRLALARTDGVPDAAREVFIRDMLPQSMAVLQEALTGPDIRLAVAVALKVVEGLKAMDAPAAAAVADQMEVTLEQWKMERTVRRVGPATPVGEASAAGDGHIIDATPIPPADPAGAASAGSGSPETVQLPAGTSVADGRADAAPAQDSTDPGQGGGDGSMASGRHGDSGGDPVAALCDVCGTPFSEPVRSHYKCSHQHAQVED